MADTLERLQTAVAGRYAIEQEVGRGGMAVVYRARDLQHNRSIALKVLRPELAASIGADRFLREIQIEASLQHPHILPLYDSGRANGTLYYTMPYVQGETLRQRLAREKQLPVEEVVKIVTQVGDAVSYAHSHGVVHRDLKPENIMFSEGHALVSDFGVARAVSEAGGEQLTDSGVAVGTPAYMSPEQATGAAGVDARSDVYSLGLVVYEMLAGDPPFTGTTPQMVMAKQAAERVPSLEIVRPNLPFELVNVIEKALAKVPADRYQTATEFCEALSQGASGETQAVRPRPRRKRSAIVAAAVAVVLTTALIVWRLLVAAPGLDPNLVVLYPLEWGGPTANGSVEDPQLGENVALVILATLDGKTSLRWVFGRDLLPDRYRENVRLVRESQKSDFAARQGAAWYVDGRVIPLPRDSGQVLLQLHQVGRDRPVARADTTGLVEAATQLGVLAAGELVLSLLPSGQSVDVSNVAGRKPEAIEMFVQGESDFHAGRFATAYEHFNSAVALDREFALAAVRGAQSAPWNHRAEEATDLIDVALEHEETLAPKMAVYARGFRAFFRNQADSAVHYFERAIEMDREWAEGWMGLGEVYTHLLPSKSPQDSLGRDAFERVYALANQFTPALYHLIEYAVIDRDLNLAHRLLAEQRRADSTRTRTTRDSLTVAALELMVRCAEGGPEEIDWAAKVSEDVNHVYQAARKLGVGGAYPQCALAAWRAIVDNHRGNFLFSSFAGLQSMFAATGQVDELKAFVDSIALADARLGAPIRLYYITDALAGIDVGDRAREAADDLRDRQPSLNRNRLWFLGVWDAYHGRLENARAIRYTLAVWAQQYASPPTVASLVDSVDRIATNLDRAIEQQDFETAARLRDQKREVEDVLRDQDSTTLSRLDSLGRVREQAVREEDYELAALAQERERGIRASIREKLEVDQVERYRQLSLLANSLGAHIALAEADTSEAILRFGALVPGASRADLSYPWESLGLERLFRAKLLLAWENYEEAFRAAQTFDSPGAVNVIYPTFIRQSLEVRLEAARGLGWEQVANGIEARIARLRVDR
jgi:tetratricopeptide (TPR) repeat protein